MAMVAMSGVMPSTIWKRIGAWTAGAVWATAMTTPATSAAVTGRTSIAASSEARSRRRCQIRNRATSRVPPATSAMRMGDPGSARKPVAPPVTASRPRAQSPCPAASRNGSGTVARSGTCRRTIGMQTAAATAATANAGQRPGPSRVAPRMAGATALAAPSAA